MKKTLLCIVLALTIFFLNQNVFAQTDSFYKAETIERIYMGLSKNGNTYYQEGVVLRRVSDGQPSYCISPFDLLRDDHEYTIGPDPENIDQETWNKVSAIAYFGYNYKGHEGMDWYFITQKLIWEAIDPEANFFFTEWFEGEPTDFYAKAERDLWKLVNDYLKDPSWNGSTLEVLEGKPLVLEDKTKVLHYYESKEIDSDMAKEENTLTLIPTEEKTYHFKRDFHNYDVPPIAYQNSSSQQMMSVGNIAPKEAIFSIKLKKGKITLIKKTEDLNQNQKFEANITFAIYDEKNQKLGKMTTDDLGYAEFELPYGVYTLRQENTTNGFSTVEDTTFTIEEKDTELHFELVDYEIDVPDTGKTCTYYETILWCDEKKYY